MLADSSTGKDTDGLLAGISSLTPLHLIMIMLSILQERQPISESLQKNRMLDRALSHRESILVNLVELRSPGWFAKIWMVVTGIACKAHVQEETPRRWKKASTVSGQLNSSYIMSEAARRQADVHQ